MRRTPRLQLLLAICILVPAAAPIARAQSWQASRGDVAAHFQDNSDSPRVLSGLQSLFHLRAAADYDAFDPVQRGASAGLNFEHIIGGHANPANRFTPRHGPARMEIDEAPARAILVREAADSPWQVDSRLNYQLVAPHYIDFEFRCTPQEASRFGPRRYAVFFFANYMNQVRDVALHFRGQAGPDEEQCWQRAEAPAGHVDYNGGGTYRALEAAALRYDANHNFKLNLWSYDWPRYTEPFYFGLAENGMTAILMFDRAHSADDEIRFSLFKFKVQGETKKPAWDFQYVVHRVRQQQTYGFRGRMVWKPFVSREDCRREYREWVAELAAR